MESKEYDMETCGTPLMVVLDTAITRKSKEEVLYEHAKVNRTLECKVRVA